MVPQNSNRMISFLLQGEMVEQKRREIFVARQRKQCCATVFRTEEQDSS